MIFLSAQPDNYYFLWQLELQLFNFSQLGIAAENIHVLIAYDPRKGLSQEFCNFKEANKAGSFFVYPDTRLPGASYLSSIRPHIIKQHFEAYPHLQDEVIFYHDSDILFREVPALPVCSPNNWYVSDTRSYLDSNYIISSAGHEVLNQMCALVDIKPETVRLCDNNAGGAQYLLTGTSVAFWDKVEKDAEALYKLLREHNREKGEDLYITTGAKISRYHGIQAWCSDMWALLWNALRSKINVAIAPQLDFCWPYDNIAHWQGKNILHYAGVTKNNDNKLFFKGQYVHYPPYYDDFSQLDNTTCSLAIKEIVEQYASTLNSKRIDLQDVTFLMPLRIDSEDRLENLDTTIKYLNKHFITNIIVLEADEQTMLGKLRLPANVKHIFQYDDAPLLHRTKWNSRLVKTATTPIVAIYDVDVIFPVSQVVAAVNSIRNGKADYVLPYNGEFVCIDKLFKKIFMKLLDAGLFMQNLGKFAVASKRSFGGCAFIITEAFVNAGIENMNITSWGPEDIERPKRMRILGYKVLRIDGPLFHLHHKRGINSGYNTEEDRVRLMQEYLKICSMRKKELEAYIPCLQQN